jgi:tripartite-type tricarboxylate transporter receptor subunit TctC
MRPFRFAAFTLVSALAVTPAAAQEPYPTRPIHIIVPFPAGGPSDVLTRTIGERMSADFGQAIVVDNRNPAANGLLFLPRVRAAEHGPSRTPHLPRSAADIRGSPAAPGCGR